MQQFVFSLVHFEYLPILFKFIFSETGPKFIHWFKNSSDPFCIWKILLKSRSESRTDPTNGRFYTQVHLLVGSNMHIM